MRWVITIALIVGFAGAALPGPQQMVLPEAFGFEEVAPAVFAPPSMTDDARRRALAALDAGETVVEAWFGRPFTRPMVVLCPGDSCDAAFGDNGRRGAAYGSFAVRLGDSGMTPVIAAHEFTHTELKREVGLLRVAAGAFPAWFDEGLAVLVSGDTRFDAPVPKAVLADLRARDAWWQWDALVEAHGSRVAYAGATTLVEEILDEIGRTGVLAVVSRMAEGAGFADALAAVRGG
ncbi:hypothetical protein [Algicella marina]|uniref:Peptidase MA-like domain-containing protein n=1 Tax=Algicella marina TaxID=2683284 RepID=A0A6P1STI3_9RHOB|nr:hypothetical protein [Algicella marina]QHQ33738.1 hypothetical protein GO499_00360 [Algicella marina]